MNATTHGKVTILAADGEHPNKHKFNGVLTFLNAYSDKSPGGASGRRVYISAEVGETALSTLVGMGVNVKSDLSGHDPTLKVGVFESASLGEALDDGRVPVLVEGYLYAHDFPDIVEDLVANKDDLGFSYETTDTYAQDDGKTLNVTSLVFTGAAILLKSRAAYQTTSFAAESEDDMNEEQMKEMMAAMGFGSIEDMLKWFSEFKSAFNGDGRYAWLEVHLSAEAEKDAKIEALSQKVEELEGIVKAQAESLQASADEKPNLEGFVKVEDYTALKASLDEAIAKIEALAPLSKEIEELRAEAVEREAHSRKSMAGVQLLAKYDPIGEVSDLNAEIEKINARNDLSAVEKVAKIMEARAKANKA